MKNPITRRRERRILVALTYFGPLDEFELYGLLHAFQRSLTKALLNLTAEGLISYERRPSLIEGGVRVWSLRDRSEGAS